jgi:23S rRNA pseudouridine1911/1915/1917 synthase
LYHCVKDLSGIGGVARPVIFHRLDKDTSGLIIIAKNDLSHQKLVQQFKEREIEKVYYALVCGEIAHENGLIDAEIGRSINDRKKMSVGDTGFARAAQTKFSVVKRFFDGQLGNYTLCRIKLITGRTHQIRVHFASIDHPLVGDRLYGNKKNNNLFEKQFGLKRQFLNAQELHFFHPLTQVKLDFVIDFPNDLAEVLKGLKNEKKEVS